MTVWKAELWSRAEGSDSMSLVHTQSCTVCPGPGHWFPTAGERDKCTKPLVLSK